MLVEDRKPEHEKGDIGTLVDVLTKLTNTIRRIFCSFIEHPYTLSKG